jgi:hypothetical protein
MPTGTASATSPNQEDRSVPAKSRTPAASIRSLSPAPASGCSTTESAYGAIWQAARTAAFTTAQHASPLARRAYDLRHAAVSLWLNAGVPATEVARRAGHSVAVLLKVYAHCIDGQADAANQRITDALITQMTSSPERTGGARAAQLPVPRPRSACPHVPPTSPPRPHHRPGRRRTASAASGPHQGRRVNPRTEPRSVRGFTGQRPGTARTHDGRGRLRK